MKCILWGFLNITVKMCLKHLKNPLKIFPQNFATIKVHLETT